MNNYMISFYENDDENKNLIQETIKARNENSCKNKIKRNKEYKNITICSISRIPTSKEFYEEQEENNLDYEDIDENDFSDIYPNAETKEDIEELEHAFSRFMDS